jgi:uncharacterized protein YjaZ
VSPPQSACHFAIAAQQIILQLGRTAQSSLAGTLHLWLPRDLAHEVNHSARSLCLRVIT